MTFDSVLPARPIRRWFALSIIACLGCSGDKSAPPPAANPPAAGSAEVSEPVAAAPAMPGGTLKGTIVFEGEEIPMQTSSPIVTDPQICEKHGKDGRYPLEDYVIDAETRGVRYVMVFLKGDAVRKWANTPREDLVLDNRDCRFEPHVGLLTVGSTLEVKNSDEVYHTTHVYGVGSAAGFNYNPGLPTKGTSEKTELTRPGLYMVKCDRHGWMIAWLRVDDHPFHAVTDAKGRYEITGIPPGTHQVEVFHEKFGERPAKGETLEVQIEVDQTATLDLKLSL